MIDKLIRYRCDCCGKEYFDYPPTNWNGDYPTLENWGKIYINEDGATYHCDYCPECIDLINKFASNIGSTLYKENFLKFQTDFMMNKTKEKH